ncbi:UNKNOWN [Stylonychia lemnae]|uniref:N-acetyltransferase domain-containing protein n=1 Tax=Stylonychia lemnae TaxID=5949 RepID=A0A078AF99_STYLE|nr:UNKNOWN [Stylonychia lemnae]|eukprot:CDW80521.1 UNKNOWN [Stylonychia lemnae]
MNQQITQQQFTVKRIESLDELDMAMKMRTKVIQTNQIFKKFSFDQIYSGEEQRATQKIIQEGFGYCALNEFGEIVSVVLSFDLTFEPYQNPDQLTPPQLSLYKARNQALAILNPEQKGQAYWVGYSATKEECRRQGLQWKMILTACQEGHRRGIQFAAIHIISFESHSMAKAFGMHVFGYSEASDPTDKRQYFMGDGEFTKEMGINAVAIIEVRKLQELVYSSKL